MADLPRMVLLRSARIVRAGALRKILTLGDKIILDSLRPGAPGFGELGSLLSSGFVAGDLAWTRLTGTRSLISRLLAGRTPHSIEIAFTGREPGPLTRYLQAWLATCLPSTRTALHGGKSDGDGIPCEVRADGESLVRFCAGGAEYDGGDLRHFATLTESDEERLLSEEIGIAVHDAVFERALRWITA